MTYISRDVRTCFVCEKELLSRNFYARIKERKILRIKIKDEIRTFHKKCFNEFKVANPNWASPDEEEN